MSSAVLLNVKSNKHLISTANGIAWNTWDPIKANGLSLYYKIEEGLL